MTRSHLKNSLGDGELHEKERKNRRLPAVNEDFEHRTRAAERAPGIFKIISRKLHWFVLYLGLSFSSHAFSNNEVENFVRDYYSSFSAQDINKLSSELFHPNAQAVFGEHVASLSSKGEVQQLLSAILTSLAKKGYTRSVIKDIVQKPFGTHFVFDTVLFEREREDGSKIDAMCSSYSVIKTNHGWRFLQWVPSEPQADDRC